MPLRFYQIVYLMDAGGVKAVGRLVQNEDRRTAQQRPARPSCCFMPREYFSARRSPNSDSSTNSKASSTVFFRNPKIRRITSKFSRAVRLA